MRLSLHLSVAVTVAGYGCYCSRAAGMEWWCGKFTMGSPSHSLSRVCVGGLARVASGVTVTRYSVVHRLCCVCMVCALSAETATLIRCTHRTTHALPFHVLHAVNNGVLLERVRCTVPAVYPIPQCVPTCTLRNEELIDQAITQHEQLERLGPFNIKDLCQLRELRSHLLKRSDPCD